MLNIAVKIRLLELYLREQRASRIIVDTENILGLDIPIKIPDIYQQYKFLNGINNMHNPQKIGTGKYIFGKMELQMKILQKFLKSS